eukprot:m.51976 g.51976  ORF g.51976 m.51976 type:complete len:171 (-) comp48394_c0_seq3:721-1233(-)
MYWFPSLLPSVQTAMEDSTFRGFDSPLLLSDGLLPQYTRPSLERDLSVGEDELIQAASASPSPPRRYRGRVRHVAICPECQKVFPSQSKLLRHLVIHAKTPEARQPVMCEFCGIRLSQRAALLKHCDKYHTDQVPVARRAMRRRQAEPQQAASPVATESSCSTATTPASE